VGSRRIALRDSRPENGLDELWEQHRERGAPQLDRCVPRGPLEQEELDGTLDASRSLVALEPSSRRGGAER
jgi:hypothetical protein